MFERRDILQLNEFANIASFKRTWALDVLTRCDYDIVGLFCGNQAGKTCTVAYSYVLRILSWHPIPHKNVVYWECDCGREYNGLTRPKELKCACGKDIRVHQRGSRIIRFASQTLPGQSGSADEKGEASNEVKNTQYPEFKKWLPPFLIKKDITYRNVAMTLYDIYGGPDITVEFVSYSQPPQATAGPQRMSIWEDEQPPRPFYDEQLPRLLAERGDLVITLTPADEISYLYDEVFLKAKKYFRSEHVCSITGEEREEETDSHLSIGVIQLATDDNPTLDKEYVERLYSYFDDPDVVQIRRYGLFKQISGRIFKDFDRKVHVVSKEKYLPEGPLYTWKHSRLIDYHENEPWAVVFLSLTPQDEIFVWWDYNPSPEHVVNREIGEQIATHSKDFKYRLNLFDPLASKTQTNTGKSTVDDFNELFKDFKREGICSGGIWETWDTRSTLGREKVRERLKNSLKVGRPFNNAVITDGRKTYLPTIWFLDTLRYVPKSMQNWRMGRDKPEQKWSHFCMCLEAVLKDSRFKTGVTESRTRPERKRYFQGRR